MDTNLDKKKHNSHTCFKRNTDWRWRETENEEGRSRVWIIKWTFER